MYTVQDYLDGRQLPEEFAGLGEDVPAELHDDAELRFRIRMLLDLNHPANGPEERFYDASVELTSESDDENSTYMLPVITMMKEIYYYRILDRVEELTYGITNT